MDIYRFFGRPTIHVILLGISLVPVQAQQLTGYSVLDANSFATGPTSGQFIDGGVNGVVAPFVRKQPVQGFSAILDNKDGTFWVLSDNGFGNKSNSQDYVLRIYRLRPDFRTVGGGTGNIEVVEDITLSDPHRRIPWKIVADLISYPESEDDGSKIAVDPSIKSRRLLTGGDFDVESFRVDADGNFWIGEEFGPLMLQFNRSGELLSPPVVLDGVAGPDDPAARTTTHPRSGGYEGMSSNQAKTLLYPMLEQPTNSDSSDGRRRLQINLFDPLSGTYTGERYYYPLDRQGVAIGAFSPINDHLHMVIERDGKQGKAAKFKKIFLVDLRQRDPDDNLVKQELVDLLEIDDPYDLDQDGSTMFRFSFATSEGVVTIDERTIAVANDNNFPFTKGRGPDIDNSEFILIRFDKPLASMEVPNPRPMRSLVTEPLLGDMPIAY